MAKEAVYAIYEGDKFLDIGTKKELAKKFNVKPKTIGFLASPSQIKRLKNIELKGMVAVRIGKVDDGFEQIS